MSAGAEPAAGGDGGEARHAWIETLVHPPRLSGNAFGGPEVDVAEALLRFPGLSLALRATDGSVMASAGPYENWAACEVAVDVPGFSGRFQWNVMPPEVLRFAADLEALHRKLPQGGEVTFRPCEPNVVLAFRLLSTGRVAGSYELRSEFVGGARLTGDFEADQSYLPDIVQSLRRFAREIVAA